MTMMVMTTTTTMVVVMMICFEICLVSSAPVDRNEKAKDFLKRYGYARDRVDYDEQEFKRSLKKLQNFTGIKVSGTLDKATITIMNRPRCQHPDIETEPEGGARPKSGRKKRYALMSHWINTTLTYNVNNYPGKTISLSNEQLNVIVGESFKVWGQHAPKLTFSRAANSARINIKFLNGSHGDNYPFDGPSGVLGHAFYPPNGNVHLDDAETWSDGQALGVNFRWIAVHEFGHVLGLAHSNVTSAVMFPFYPGYRANVTLDRDDITAIKTLYP